MSEGGRVVLIGDPYREVKTLHASSTNSDGDSCLVESTISWYASDLR